ncbi:DUF4381 domain-containing protein [Hydrocarboniclastica marina]|uniref:DUF4381 domain-containing protein n=1 Tax=Hydrocarboniclastica marina TaxID=2259620 RepID=A0A4P7XGF3_9ALTE|nr:DUF4381 domain-containing protein [Hydrocarboniclastica marina]QCF25713.1 DUF4381 domain-containing protein [Hydrocarboniclastica marina]
MNETDPLANLRDIHLPPPIEHWPPAIGWWLLAALVLAALVLIIRWLVRRRRRRAWRRVALAVLPDPKGKNSCDTAFYTELNRVLKRAARVNYPNAGTDHMSGEEWTLFLAQKAPRNSTAEFVALTQAPYQPEAEIPPQAAYDLARAWLRSQPC